MIKNLIFLFLFAISISACKKQPLTSNDSSFQGVWKHQVNEDELIYITIDEYSMGTMEFYKYGKFKSDTQRRKWLIKDNRLYFGRMATKKESDHIDVPPTVSTQVIVLPYDSIPIGKKYMVLSGKYYH